VLKVEAEDYVMLKRIQKTAMITMAVGLLMAGCGTNEETVKAPGNHSGEKVIVYTTLFPIYDFAKKIGGQHVDVRSLLPAGAESHDFEPSPKDIASVNEADLFIYNGAGFEGWVDKVVDNLDTTKVSIVSATEGIELLDVAELGDVHADENGEEGEHGEEHGDEHAGEGENADEHGHEDGGKDPHVWLDPNLAKVQAYNVFVGLSKVDPVHTEDYKSNFESLIDELTALDADLRKAVELSNKREIVVAHAAFGYLAHAYGLEQIAVSGVTPSDEPSQKELLELIEVLKEHNISYVAFDDLVESKVAETLLRETGAQAVTLMNLENVTKEQLSSGVTYIDLMRLNLETLKKVLE
jgi:zinc transport system substrate-binding protein